MRGKVKIGDKDVEMLANAASPILFKMVFHQDWFKTMSGFQNDESGIEGIESLEQMGFIMAMQATKKNSELTNMTADDYLNWLMQFESEALMIAVADIAAIYRGQETTSSQSKKEDG